MQFWARAGAGKRGGGSELHATLIKATVKKVFTVVGPEGKSRMIAKSDHVVDGLRQLVNAARVGRFFHSEWTQELMYTFVKVPGAMGLENSRPVGLLKILQKARMPSIMQQSLMCGRKGGYCIIRNNICIQSKEGDRRSIAALELDE